MKVIAPIAVTEAVLTASSITEDENPVWDSGTTYAEGDRINDLANHRIYESVQGSNLNNDPLTDDGTNWAFVSATNKWKAFDQRLADQASGSGTISYTITAPSLVSGIAFFNISAAQVTVTVTDVQDNQTYSKTVELADDTEIVDWFTFFTTDIEGFITETLIADFVAYPGYEIEITIGDEIGTSYVGQIALGKVVALGDTLEGTTIGLTSYSTKEVDEFGSWTIVPRAKSDPVNFDFAMPASAAGRVKRILTALRDTPAVYFADETLVADYGAMTYGLFQDYEIPLRKNGVSIVQLEIEGLT